MLIGCSGVQTAKTAESTPEPVTVAKRFMVGIIAADANQWRRRAVLPIAWNQRCNLLTQWSAVSALVAQQKPPAGAVEVLGASRLTKPSPTASDSVADRFRAFADVRTSCGGHLDSVLAKLRSLEHALVRVDLKTPEGAHVAVIRVSLTPTGWRVSGIR